MADPLQHHVGRGSKATSAPRILQPSITRLGVEYDELVCWAAVYALKDFHYAKFRSVSETLCEQLFEPERVRNMREKLWKMVACGRLQADSHGNFRLTISGERFLEGFLHGEDDPNNKMFVKLTDKAIEMSGFLDVWSSTGGPFTGDRPKRNYRHDGPQSGNDFEITRRAGRRKPADRTDGRSCRATR